MRADERVLVMGEDIGVFGGAFKVTDGFIEEFGAERVMDTPLAESAIIGTAVGAAVVGHAPGLRDAVRRLHLLRLRPARQRRRQDALPPGPGGADHRAPALRRRLLRRPVPLAEPRGVVHALARDQGRRAVDRRGRQGAAARRHPRPQPGRASWSTSTSTAASRARCPRACYETPFTARVARPGTRPRGDRLRRDGPRGAGGDRGPRRRVDRGARPALARAARRGGDPRLGARAARRW